MGHAGDPADEGRLPPPTASHTRLASRALLPRPVCPGAPRPTRHHIAGGSRESADYHEGRAASGLPCTDHRREYLGKPTPPDDDIRIDRAAARMLLGPCDPVPDGRDRAVVARMGAPRPLAHTNCGREPPSPLQRQFARSAASAPRPPPSPLAT